MHQTESFMDDVFDVTKLDGEWLNAEDKELYKVQQESRGKWATPLENVPTTIHPSKRLKASTPASMSAPSFDAVQETDTESHPEDLKDKSNQPHGAHSSTRKHHKTVIAMNLVTGTKISTSKAAKIRQQLSDEGVNIATPSQPAVYKALFRRAAQVSSIKNCALFWFTVLDSDGHIVQTWLSIVLLRAVSNYILKVIN